MKDLISKIEELRNSDAQKTVKKRMSDFKEMKKRKNDVWFSELSFCILTANSSAELGIKIQDELGPSGFIEIPVSELKKRLKELGYRFYRIRAEYIVEAREYSDEIKDIITEFSDSQKAREWLVNNVKGIGYKEGSHFLRNVGREDLAILDRHVLRILEDWDVIECVPKTLTKNRYLSIEEEVKKLADKIQLPPSEIDLYLWDMATGRILK